MRPFKRIFVVVMMVTLIISSVAVPASATTLSFWQTRFRDIPQIQKYSTETNVNKAVQRFLYVYPATASRIRSAGGIDGNFGSTTEWAVEKFQSDEFGENSVQVDGVVGPNTWAAIPKYLEISWLIYLLSYYDEYNRSYDMYWIEDGTYDYNYHTYDNNNDEIWFHSEWK